MTDDRHVPGDDTVQMRLAPLAAASARRRRPAPAPVPRPVIPPDLLPQTAPRAVLSRALTVPLVVVLVGLIPAVIGGMAPETARNTAFWLQLAVTVYAGARLCAMILTARRRLIAGSIWLFCYVAMGVAVLAQLSLGQTPTPLVGTSGDLTLAVALVLLGFVAFDVGALLARHRPAPRQYRLRRTATVSKRRLFVLVLVAYLCSAVFVASLGGPAVFFSSRQAISDHLTAGGTSSSQVGSAFLRGFGTVPALLALLMLTRWMLFSRRARRRPQVVLPWFGLLIVNAVVNNPVSNPRYWFLTVLFALLFTVFPRSPAVYRAALTLGVAAAVLIFPFADKFRYDEGGRAASEQTSTLEPLVTKDYDQTVMLANTISWVDSGHGHTYGEQLAASTFFFVPRSIWQDKPLDSGVRVGQWMGTSNTNLSSPLWAELWLDFGPFGMTAGFLGIGYCVARVDRRFARSGHVSRDPGNLLAVVVPCIAGYAFILLRGPLLQTTGRIGIAVLCVALVMTFRGGEQHRLD
ncbi:O-antigen polymerase [Streptomyces sp. NPDC051940]|uniref:O-antigen polymerase n=1 Tax=Streptomyces sp. NPDC051940 TaxID=3155675 RepID=UPI003436F754